RETTHIARTGPRLSRIPLVMLPPTPPSCAPRSTPSPHTSKPEPRPFCPPPPSGTAPPPPDRPDPAPAAGRPPRLLSRCCCPLRRSPAVVPAPTASRRVSDIHWQTDPAERSSSPRRSPA